RRSTCARKPMAIVAECAVCGRKYQADDAMAGKRVKCKQCGHVFALPYGGADPTVDFGALAELERAYEPEGGATSYVPPPSGSAQIGAPALTRMARTGDADDYELEGVARGPRPNTRFNFPYSRQ